jgi:hypothetical protein
MTKIVFTATNTLLGRLIRWVTRSKVSHVFIEYPSQKWGGQWALESGAVGVRKVPAERARHDIVFEFECVKIPDRAFKQIGQYVGTRYDVGGLFVFAWAKIVWRWSGRKIRKPLNNTHGQFCSELVSRFFKAANIIDDRLADPELVSPQTIYSICVNKPDMFRLIK